MSFFGSESCCMGCGEIFWKLLKKWPFPLGISEGAINGFPCSNKIIREIFQKHLDKWLSPLGISEEVIKMASILMSQQKSRSRKRHQFWCHRRKSAPIWSLVLSTTDKIRQFWAENKLFSRKAHKNRFFVLYPLRDKKYHSTRNFWRFSMATLWGRKIFIKVVYFWPFSMPTRWERNFQNHS